MTGLVQEHGDEDAPPHVDLFVRSLAPHGSRAPQEDVIKELDRLTDAGRIAGFDIHVWGERFDETSVAARTEMGEFVRRTLMSFQAWATRTGRSLDTFFEQTEVRSTLTGEEYQATVLPTLVLAEYQDEELTFVAPSSDGETVHTVEDRLDALAMPPEATAGSAPSSPAGETSD